MVLEGHLPLKEKRRHNGSAETSDILGGLSVKLILASSILVCVVVLGVVLFSGSKPPFRRIEVLSPADLELMETGLSRMSVQMVEINQRIDSQPFKISEKTELNDVWISLDRAWTEYKTDPSRPRITYIKECIDELRRITLSIRGSVKSEVVDSREVDVQYIFFYIDGLSDNLKAMGRFLKEHAA